MHELHTVATNEQTWTDLLQEITNQGAPPHFVTLTTPIRENIHPLGLLWQTTRRDSFYWITRDRRTFMSAIGTIAQFQATGPDRFEIIRRDLNTTRFLYNESPMPAPHGQGPLLYGGFAFSPSNAYRGQPWSEFPDGLLIVPAFTAVQHDGVTWLSQTVRFNSSTSSDQREIAHRLEAERTQVIEKLRAYNQIHDQIHDKMRRENANQYPTMSVSIDDSAGKRWTEAVNQLTRQARDGHVVKTVLSHHVDLDLPAEVSMELLLARLEVDHPQSYIFALTRGGRTFLGATPERLIQVERQHFRSEALAGSTPRGTTESEDIRLAHELLNSDKERHEQHIVLEWLIQRLEQWCPTLDTPGEPSVVRFPKVQHLHTPIAGKLRESTHILELVDAIHPTPAVGGYPLDAALKLIATHEQEDRGWYAGPVGWLNKSGEGEFAVAIRSALIDESRARLFAGCGIVDGSDPKKELAEASLKLGVIFDSLVRAIS